MRAAITLCGDLSDSGQHISTLAHQHTPIGQLKGVETTQGPQLSGAAHSPRPSCLAQRACNPKLSPKTNWVPPSVQTPRQDPRLQTEQKRVWYDLTAAPLASALCSS
jgi:hypothetical protein